MDWVDGRPLQNLTMQMLWKILLLIFLEIGHRLGLADSPPTSPVCPDVPVDPEEEEPDDNNVLDEVGADAPCVTDEPEAERYLPENPRLRATPPRQRPGLADPACLGFTSMMNWNGQEALRNTPLLTDLDQEALERTNPRRELVVCLWSPLWLTPPGVRYCKKTRANQLCC